MAYPPNPSLQDIKDELSITDATKDGVLQRLLNGAFDYVSRKTRRQFTTGIETRYFHGTGKGYLVIDDFQSGTITGLKLLNPDRTPWRTYAPVEYVTRGARPNEPVHYRIDIINAITENPYRVIGPNPFTFAQGMQNVEVTATFGAWGVLPDGLESLIIDMVCSKYSRPKGIRSASVGGESLTFAESDLTDGMKETLEEYKRALVGLYPS